MHILCLPSWYRTPSKAQRGIFFVDQANVISRDNKVSLVAVSKMTPRDCFRKFPSRQDIKFQEINQLCITSKYLKLIGIDRLLSRYKKIIREYIKTEGRPDIVHLQSFFRGDIALWLKDTFGIPYVITEHYGGWPCNRMSPSEIEFGRKVFEGASCRIAVSQFLSDCLTKKFNMDFNCVYNSVDAKQFKPSNMALDNNEFHFVNIGNLNPNKNQAMLIDAFAKTFGAHGNVKLKILGNGSLRRKLQVHINRHNLQNQVFLLGDCPRSQIAETLQESHVLVSASLVETFGVNIIEGMSCGLPVVATRSGGVEEILSKSKLGLLCDVSEESITNALKTIKQTYSQYDTEVIRRHALEHFSNEILYEKLMRIYKEVLR